MQAQATDTSMKVFGCERDACVAVIFRDTRCNFFLLRQLLCAHEVQTDSV